MAKRRTREQKIKPHHHFTISWSPEAKRELIGTGVKGQITRGFEAKSQPGHAQKSAENAAKAEASGSAKRAIARSLILVSFILCLELVIYLAWH